MYTVRELHTPWTADHRGKSVRSDKLEVVASFCYLGDMLSAAGGCELLTTTCENLLEEVQGTACATSSLFPPLLFKDMWPHVQLLCEGHNAPCHWDLATDKAKPPVCSWMTGQWSDRSAMSSRKTLSPSGPMSYLRSLALRIWTWHTEGEKARPVWTRGMLQWRSQDSLWHTGFWKAAERGIAERGSSQPLDFRMSATVYDFSMRVWTPINCTAG